MVNGESFVGNHFHVTVDLALNPLGWDRVCFCFWFIGSDMILLCIWNESDWSVIDQMMIIDSKKPRSDFWYGLLRG